MSVPIINVAETINVEIILTVNKKREKKERKEGIKKRIKNH